MGPLVNQYYEFSITKVLKSTVYQGLQKVYTRTEGLYTPLKSSWLTNKWKQNLLNIAEIQCSWLYTSHSIGTAQTTEIGI